jgi:hypothetical protein
MTVMTEQEEWSENSFQVLKKRMGEPMLLAS